MRFRQLGRSGLTVSVLGLGCNNIGRTLDVAATRKLVDAATDAGITFFDTADIYGGHRGQSEEILGEVLGSRRDEIVLATKFGMDMAGVNGPDWGARGSRRYVRIAVEASLRRLRTDHVDLYQYHEPDGVTPVEETLAALDELVAEGKVRYVGSSNFAGWQVAQVDHLARETGATRFVSAQNEYSLLDRRVEAELVPACLEYGVGVLPFFPLANGLLTGKYSRGVPPAAGTRIADRKPQLYERAPWDVLEGLERYAAERGRTMLDVAIGGLAAQPAVASVIAGASAEEQVRANARAAEWEPTEADLDALDDVVPPPEPVR
ncbi:MAG TPA: aldo/keto reductase [Mycobacteriales bacterium]|nr:aldo/keto reductase [Mycobacteriales bacterium]